jgi:hypothetical protein
VGGGLGGDRLLLGLVGHLESRVIRYLAILSTCVSLCLLPVVSNDRYMNDCR